MSRDIRTSELQEPIDVGEYLVRRLKEVGVQSIHGLPGDFNLRLLDYIPENGLRWVGNVNELNAGYAADGYARIKGIAAVVTTFGVGELSLINAIAGAYSEFVPIVHIVGTPSTISQRNGMLLHHTLGNGDFRVFGRMSAQVSCETAILDSPNTAATLIDHAIRECYLQSRPVYLALPTDLVEQKVEGARLADPLDLSYPPNDPEKEAYVVEVVLKYLYAAQHPVILVDACAIRHRALDETHELMAKSGLPVFVTPMGKGGVDETAPTYGGVYAGDGSFPEVRQAVESSDLVLSIGALKSDFNTAGFSYRISQLSTIDFHADLVRVRYSEYPGVRMNGVLRRVSELLEPQRLSIPTGPSPSLIAAIPESPADHAITHAWFWPRVGSWLQANDLVVTETGTSNFGIWQTRFPKGVQAISQVLWGSIGYANGSCQGAALAARELGQEKVGRTILFIGDGAFQLTVQELSTMIRLGLNPIIFVICNDGFAIERLIHGLDAAYNYIQNWNYVQLPSAFAATIEQASTYQVRTANDVEALFTNESFGRSDRLRLVEVYMPKNDAPTALKVTAERAAKRNAQTE